MRKSLIPWLFALCWNAVSLSKGWLHLGWLWDSLMTTVVVVMMMMMMIMMMMMMMMMNCFCGMVDRWKVLSLFPAGSAVSKFSPSQISDTQQAGFESAQNLCSGFIEWIYVVVIITPPRRHIKQIPGICAHSLYSFVYDQAYSQLFWPTIYWNHEVKVLWNTLHPFVC